MTAATTARVDLSLQLLATAMPTPPFASRVIDDMTLLRARRALYYTTMKPIIFSASRDGRRRRESTMPYASITRVPVFEADVATYTSLRPAAVSLSRVGYMPRDFHNLSGRLQET